MPAQTDGEAENPGPGLRVVAVNCTSLQKQLEQILKLDADVILLTEVRATDPLQRHLQDQLRKKGFRVVWGAPSTRRRFNGPIKPVGVALLVREPLRAQWVQPASQEARDFYDQGRLLHAAVALGKEVFHIIGVYGFSGAWLDRQQRAKNEPLLQQACQLVASVGNCPAMLTGDLNTTLGASPALQSALASGLVVDVAQLQADADGTVPQPTCFVRDTSQGSRIDHMLANRLACTTSAACQLTLPSAVSCSWRTHTR